MIEVIWYIPRLVPRPLSANPPRSNDRLGKKVRVKCEPDDTIGDFKKLVAAQIGTSPEKVAAPLPTSRALLTTPRAAPDCAQEVVLGVQRPHHACRLRDREWKLARDVLQLDA